ncbi:hypothetical protein H6P81_010241 [Aristolochia fimbriata]|uniref:Uncharacterized protein n=1 Tax=Aristolochia fimbriata TaxID=158543 RepID=A0AAV7EPD1_ARIFI|nr:hypothetical protein H6P81_010241 [Aristolochia fimbriata]
MWKIRRCNDEHMCLNGELRMDNWLSTSRVICNLIMLNVRTSFTLSPYEIILLVKDKYHIQVSYSRAWWARNKALVTVFGGWEESYNLLPQFLKAIKDTNRCTKYKMITTDDGVREGNFVRFDRVFWAFGPAIHGFQFCRPFISVNGTHLYGKYKGCLLIATSFDGDNRLFPLAFALVEKENIDTWTWFISCLVRQVVRGRTPMCIISDRHSGIIRAMADVFPHPHRHKFCIRHIIANLKKRYSVKDLNKMVWRCASAETVAHYDHAIQNLEACPGARAELTEDMSLVQWAFAYDGNMSFGKLTTNSSESVNSLLKRARSLPARKGCTDYNPSLSFRRRTFTDCHGGCQTCDSHKSNAIWHGEDPGCLECTEHFQTLQHWPVDERMLSYIKAAGFSALHRVQWLRLDKPLITALVERWSETNTFHLANGEMMITLEDVVVLLGLRVDGDAVTGSTRGDWMELARVLQGRASTGSFWGSIVTIMDREANFHSSPTTPTEVGDTKKDAAPLHLLYLVGATIFSDGSARGVHMAYLTLFKDFEAAGRYSLGAATLAFLYQELAKACRTGVVGIAGCLTLMQLWAWERLHTGRPTLLEEPTLQGGPLDSRWNVRRTNATNPGRNLVLYRTELDHQRSYQEDVEHVTRISRKGQAGEDWALYHRDYIAQWEARAKSVVMGSRAHTPRHAPSDYMRWYLGATRRFISPPPTEPAMVYHPRGYTEEALFGCVRNVVEHVNHRDALDPSSTYPYLMEIGHYCQSVLHSLPLLEGAIVGGDVSHAGRRPTGETTTSVSRTRRGSTVLEPTVPDLPLAETPTPEPDQPLKQPQEPEPSRHPPIRRIYTRRQKKAIGAPEPSSAL